MRLRPFPLPRTVVVGGLAAALALVLLVLTCGTPDRAPVATDPALAARVDSLLAARAADRRVIDSLAARAVTAQAVADSARLDAVAARAGAAIEGRRADRLARQAAALDTLPDVAARADGWRQAYVARTVERDSLRGVIVAQDREIVALRVSVVTWREAYERADARAEGLDEIARALRAERDKLAADARRRDRCLAGLIPCPTRRAAFTAGAIAGGVAVGAVALSLTGALH